MIETQDIQYRACESIVFIRNHISNHGLRNDQNGYNALRYLYNTLSWYIGEAGYNDIYTDDILDIRDLLTPHMLTYDFNRTCILLHNLVHSIRRCIAR